MNGPADIKWIIIHCIVFWCILLILIEWQLPCLCCYWPDRKIRKITHLDNALAFSRKNGEDETDEEGESAEVPQIVSNNGKLQVRFSTKD